MSGNFTHEVPFGDLPPLHHGDKGEPPSQYLSSGFGSAAPVRGKELQIREAFKPFNWDETGGIPLKELAEIFKQPNTATGTGSPMTPAEVQDFFSKFDVDHNGSLSFLEFWEGWRRKFGEDADSILLEALKSMNKAKGCS